jgi:outer membrane protein OmpA-like peptidoglycan-associated protein
MINWFTVLFIGFAPLGGCWAQADYTKCEGNIDINPNVSYNLSFKGKMGKDKSGIDFYCNLPITCNNFIYLHYFSLNDGQITLSYPHNQDSLVMFLFEAPSGYDCSSIARKKAKLVACELRSAIDTSVKAYQVYGKRNYYFVFHRDPKYDKSVSFRLNYSRVNTEGKIIKDSLMVNMVSNIDVPVYEIHVRDAITKDPVVAKIVILSTSNLDGTYRGSEVLLNNQKKLNASIQLAAEGYYPKDIFQHIIASNGQKDTFLLTPVTHGSITKLEDIFFMGGLAIILEESLSSLKKLRDFMVLNESVSIEIQGHVNDDGSNSISSKRLSKKRAKKIMEYLIDSGVSASRLSAVGMGNTQPVFANPETDEQKEANRRVEIKIK